MRTRTLLCTTLASLLGACDGTIDDDESGDPLHRT
jgi:hypothetical protein